MKLLTAAEGGVPGEMVVVVEACDTAGCGCANVFVGVGSSLLVTVAAVAELDITIDELTTIAHDYLTSRGWANAAEFADDLADELVEMACDWPVGARVRRVDDTLELL